MSSDVCFVCACRAVTEPLRTLADPGDPAGVAHFPFLRTMRPPPGVAQPGDQVAACHLCAELLLEQWRMHNRRNVPLTGRQYWIKAWVGIDGSSGGRTSPSPAPQTSSSRSPQSAAASETSTVKTCTMCAQVVGKDCLKVNPILLTLVPDFAPRFAPSMLAADAELCGTCQRNDGLQKVIQLVGAEHSSTIGSLMYEMLMRQGAGQPAPANEWSALLALAQMNSQSSKPNPAS